MNDDDLLNIDKFNNLDNIDILNYNQSITSKQQSENTIEQESLYYDNLLNKELNMLEKNNTDSFLNIENNCKYKKCISSKLFMDCMKMTDENFKYLNKRINNLEDDNRSNINKIDILNNIIRELFIIQKQDKEDIKILNTNIDALYKDLLILYTKYDTDISSSFKKINSNTKHLLEQILYNSEINHLVMHNKIDEAQKQDSNYKKRKRKLKETIEIMTEKVDNSTLYPRKSERIAKKHKK